jgi:hypothetical protein
MASSASSPLLSTITGAVILLHLLGVIALMFHQDPFEALHQASRIEVRVKDSREAPLAAEEPARIIAAHAEAIQESAEKTPADIAKIVAPSLEAEPQSPTPDAAVAAETAQESLPKRLAQTLQTMETKPLSIKKASPKKPTDRKQPTKAKASTLYRKNSAPQVAAPSKTNRLKQSPEAQQALQRLRAEASAQQAVSRGLEHASEIVIQPLEYGGDGCGQTTSDSSEALARLIAALQRSVILPEQGEVRMRIAINQSGQVIDLNCLSSRSAKNRVAIEKALKMVRLPVEGLVRGTTLQVVVTFKHA